MKIKSVELLRATSCPIVPKYAPDKVSDHHTRRTPGGQLPLEVAAYEYHAFIHRKEIYLVW